MTQLKDGPLTLTPYQAAELSGIGRDFIYAACRAGRLRAIKIGRNFRIPREALAEFIDELSRQAAAGQR